MKYTVYKFFSIGASEKEEKWLNQMAAKGMMLTDVTGFRYVFEQDTPGKYIYRLELLNHLPSHNESRAYIEFLEDTGIEFVGSYLRWVYFRKPTHDGVFEIYSDVESKIKHFKRITLIANVLAITFGCMAIIALGEAWNQYTIFSSKAYHIPYLIWGSVYIIMVVIFQAIIIPVRRSLRHLKSERRLRE